MEIGPKLRPDHLRRSRRAGAAAGTGPARLVWESARARRSRPSPGTTAAITSSIGRPPTPAGSVTRSTCGCSPNNSRYIINHAADGALFVDPDLVPLIERIAPTLETVRHFVVMGETRWRHHSAQRHRLRGPASTVSSPGGRGHMLDERSPMMLCYTSGTTGNPKGVAYTQRSTYSTRSRTSPSSHLGPRDNVLPVVPMFHASAWGYPWMATAVGAKLTYPGPDLTPAGLVTLFEQEKVTFSAGSADRLAGHPAIPGRAPRGRHLLDAGVSLRRLRRPPLDDRLVLEEPGHPGPAGVGDDRDEPGGVDGDLQAGDGGLGLRAPARRPRNRRPPGRRLAGQDRR